MLGIMDYNQDVKEDMISITQPNPVVLELTHLQNLLKERDTELGAAQSEIKALRATEALKDKALEELENKHNKLDEKLRISENLIQQKNLEMKKLLDEKKQALAAQYAAEAALRRLLASQKDDDSPPIESIIAPLEADIKLYRNEIASLLEDKKVLERLTKTKEAALLETEKILRSALERALIVEDIQNQNFELRRQIDICQEENKLLDKTNRQKVLEIEKLCQLIQEHEEAVLAGGGAANVVRDYKRQISELIEEKRILERELARARVSVNRVATVVANEWKDEGSKVMPVKQWLGERRVLQGEMQRLEDKLAVAERTAKAEAQLKDKFKLRLKTLEEGLKQVSSLSANIISIPKSPNCHQIVGYLPNNAGARKRSTSQPRGSAIRSRSSPLHHSTAEKVNKLEGHKSRRSMYAYKTDGAEDCGKENSDLIENTELSPEMSKDCESAALQEMKTEVEGYEDVVSGFLYDRLQKEVISLRKACNAKDDDLIAKDEEIKFLQRKVEALIKSIEAEARKARNITSEDKKAKTSADDNKKKSGKSFLRRVTKSS